MARTARQSGLKMARTILMRVQSLTGMIPPMSKKKMTTKMIVTRSEEHTSELQSLMRISYAVFCLKNNNNSAQDTKIQIHMTRNNNNYITCKKLKTENRY